MIPEVKKIVSNHNESIEFDETCIDVDSEDHSKPAQFKRGVKNIVQQKLQMIANPQVQKS